MRDRSNRCEGVRGPGQVARGVVDGCKFWAIDLGACDILTSRGLASGLMLTRLLSSALLVISTRALLTPPPLLRERYHHPRMAAAITTMSSDSPAEQVKAQLAAAGREGVTVVSNSEIVDGDGNRAFWKVSGGLG